MRKLFFIAVVLSTPLFLSAQHIIGINVGNKAPEMIGKSLTGDIIKLSDTRGKLVLIDFWAAWCRPCRMENPNIVSVYQKYNKKKFNNGEKGFTIFSVSLDKAKPSWEKAVKDDKLDWPYHISDLKGWYSKYAAVYGVRSIPSNFLIDGNGIIVAKGLRGPDLETTVRKYLE